MNLELIRHLLTCVEYDGRGAACGTTDPAIVRCYSRKLAKSGFLHR